MAGGVETARPRRGPPRGDLRPPPLMLLWPDSAASRQPVGGQAHLWPMAPASRGGARGATPREARGEKQSTEGSARPAAPVRVCQAVCLPPRGQPSLGTALAHAESLDARCRNTRTNRNGKGGGRGLEHCTTNRRRGRKSGRTKSVFPRRPQRAATRRRGAPATKSGGGEDGQSMAGRASSIARKITLPPGAGHWNAKWAGDGSGIVHQARPATPSPAWPRLGCRVPS